MNKSEYELNKKKCEACGKELEWKKRNNKYCNHSCAASISNNGIRRHGLPPNKCLKCGKKTKSHVNKYCSRKCYNSYKYESYIQKWLNGEDDGIRGGINSEEFIALPIRRWLFETRGTACCKCGWNEKNPVTGRVTTQINHIDGDVRNNRLDNLEIICPNCHSLTSNYGALNKGNGRKRRYAAVAQR